MLGYHLQNYTSSIYTLCSSICTLCISIYRDTKSLNCKLLLDSMIMSHDQGKQHIVINDYVHNLRKNKQVCGNKAI